MFSKPGIIFLVKDILEFHLGYIPLMGDKTFEGFELGNHIAFYKLHLLRKMRKRGN